MKNKKLLIPILLITFGVVSLNLDDLSFNKNILSYLLFAGAIISLGVISFLDKEKKKVDK